MTTIISQSEMEKSYNYQNKEIKSESKDAVSY